MTFREEDGFIMPFTAEQLDAELSQGYDGWTSIHNEDPDTFKSTFGMVEKVEDGKVYRDEYQFDIHVVVKVAGRFFLKRGFYMSYDGTTWDGKVAEVEKKPVTREEWVEV